jgi:hypothetical protein
MQHRFMDASSDSSQSIIGAEMTRIKYTMEPNDPSGRQAFYEVTRDQVPAREDHVKIGETAVYRVSRVTWNEPASEQSFAVVRVQSI